MSLTIDTSQFQRALREYAETTRKTGAQILNQRAYNIAGRAMDMLKPAPGGEQAQRSKIKSYLQKRRGAARRVITKTGKRSKKFVKKSLQLVVANLIIQKRRAHAGLVGLYGQKMIEAEGKFTQAAQAGVGYLKAPLIGIIRVLTGHQPSGARMPIKTRWGNISIFESGRFKATGTVIPAKPGNSPSVTMNLKWNTKGAPTKVERLVFPHLQRAFDAEAAALKQHVIDKLQKAADKINARR